MNARTDEGLRLLPHQHPRLFALIDEVSRAVGVASPAEVYLVPAVNAFVSSPGALLGFGGARVMGLGAPLLAVQNRSQLKAVIAHELGHFAGDAPKLSGVVSALRRVTLRAWEALTDRGAALRTPFGWLVRGCLWLTQAVSRRQELLADAWAVRVGGREAHAAALHLVELHAVGFERYLSADGAGPAQQPGEVVEGYQRFVRSAQWKRLLPELEAEVAARAAQPFDSHPTLAERLLWARQLEAAEVPEDTRGAWELLEGPGSAQLGVDRIAAGLARNCA